MQHGKRILTSILSLSALVLLVLDAKTALNGAKEGIALCLYTVIPSLFPFFFVSGVINSQLIGAKIPLLRPLGKLCGMPSGSESVLLLGLMGGYPVGAQVIYDGYKRGHIKQNTAHRLLGFCSNAGPAFIFGILSSVFSSTIDLWLIWLVHILSAIIVGLLLPGKSQETCSISCSVPFSITHSLQNSLKVTANICGWIIIFRVVLSFLRRWFLWLLPTQLQVVVIGILELSNGCIELSTITSEAIRFIICCSMLSFGGICVGMQTAAVTRELGIGLYLPGKLLQVLISIIFAILIQLIRQPKTFQPAILVLAACVLSVVLICVKLNNGKKVVALQAHLLYNDRKVGR